MEIHKTICDRCKKELVEKPVRQFTIYNGNLRVDLCEDCYRFFYTWMEKPEDLATANKKEYYKKPAKPREWDADNNICDSCAFNTRTGYHYEICDNCYKGGQFVPKKEENEDE